MSEEKKTVTVGEDHQRQIEEMKKHPGWSTFRAAYEELTEVEPEKSAVPVLVILYWKMFLIGGAWRESQNVP